MTSLTTNDDRRAPRRPTPKRRDADVLIRLDEEWRRLDRRPSSLRRIAGWVDRLADPIHADALSAAVASATCLDDVLASTHRHSAGGSLSDPDELLGALVTLSASDDLAARLVLQRILPGVIAQAARWSKFAYDANVIDVAIGASWISIRSYDITRRRRHIAASLVSDVIWVAFQRPSRRRSSTEIPTPNSVFADRPAPHEDIHPIVALAGTMRAAACGGTERHHLDVIRDLARLESPSAMASQREVTPRTIRNRRRAAVAEIRRSLGPDWTDWTDPLTAAA